MSPPSGLLRVLVATSVVLFARSAGAQASASPAVDRPLRVEYHAFPGCPNVGAFFAGVRARVSGARSARAGELAPTHVVSLWANAGRITGRLSIDRPDGAPLTRNVSADTCDEAVAALAFVVALSLDPDAASAEPAPEAVRSSSSSPPAPTERATGSVLGGGQGSSAIASSASFGAFLGVELALPLGPLRPSFRASGSFLTGGTAAVGLISASFRSVSGRVDACPSSTKLSILRLSPCVGLELGSLRAEGRGLDVPVTEARFWSAAHVLGRARLSATPRLFVELEIGAVVPLTARRFLVDTPPLEVFATPAIAVAGALGLGVSFP